jgi:hypothetical protein
VEAAFHAGFVACADALSRMVMLEESADLVEVENHAAPHFFSALSSFSQYSTSLFPLKEKPETPAPNSLLGGRSSQDEVQGRADRADRPRQPCKSSALYRPNLRSDESVSLCEPASTLPLNLPIEIVFRGSLPTRPL